MEHHNEVVPGPLMTMRISRDSGRSWSPVREVRADDCKLSPLSLSSAWPPCLCPRHRPATAIGRDTR